MLVALAVRPRSSKPNISHRVFAIVEGVPNVTPPDAQKLEKTNFAANSALAIWYPRVVNEMRMLAQAIKEANSDEPKAVAAKLEGMKFKTFDGGEGYMRKDDHQFFQDMYIANFGPLDPGAKFDEEKTGWGWKNAGHRSRPRTPNCRRPARWTGPPDLNGAGTGLASPARIAEDGGPCSRSSFFRR